MKRKLLYIAIALGIMGLNQSCGQSSVSIQPLECASDNASEVNGVRMVAVGNNQIVKHKAFTLSYNEEHEQPDWVAYMLTREMANGQLPRTDDFREDEDVVTQSAQLEDYRRSGYTRGHLVPAGDMKWDKEAMSETFLLSNMSPQDADFNDGIWNKLEGRVRQWARYYGTVYVVTGPVLEEGLPTIGNNEVSVPQCFYKVIYVPDRQMMIGFLVDHRGAKNRLQDLAVPVDSVEDCTGLDFFPTMGEEMESSVDITRWKW